ncbi:SSS family transporter [Lipingzhangella halophila]|uniref:SSS family transporter n=1 Tax=Lipingzhangella halophila TaxID=1783352 RepID=A0A7W7RCM9_9ACTN|nr:sodium:solute symporter [Lipingzhangella halophila]MBB4929560.1 SSS family transporter [Lipingzhangella halophila]
MQPLDLIVIAVYLLCSAWLGLKLSGRQRTTKDYFIGSRQMPWWAVCLSVVATETSALTVISVPGVAYLDNVTFLQVAIGYLIGRVIVAFVLLPRYYRGEMTTAYAYLGERFGRGMQSTASVTFLFTRLLADGVRLFAAAIPMKLILNSYGVELSYFWIVALLGVVTILYTLIGGIRAVVWVDVLQMGLYLAGGIIALGVIINQLDINFLSYAADAGKTQFLDFTSNPISAPYATVTAVVGGALLSTASHGADQIIVQRLLGCRTLRDAQKAVIGSAVLVFFQFAMFLTVGLALFAYFEGASLDQLGLANGDALFPHFILEGLPAGISGLLLAGIMASAMSTLSSSLSALSSSTMADLYQRFTRRTLPDAQALKIGRLFTLGWGLVFIGAAAMFTGTDDPVVELGLSVASLTYGGLLGAFFLGLWVRRARQLDAIIAFCVAVLTMVWLFLFQPDLVGFTWYTGIGLAIVVGLGFLLSRRHRTDAPGFDASNAPAPAGEEERT